ncbi:MAG: hypothetical protein H8E47_03710 [Anaerolineales bacterium]|nr:hypothetical protein [Anaerolineales bacterium]
MFRKWEETASGGGDLQLRRQLTIPARVNIIGNPADANEGAHATISAAIDTYDRKSETRFFTC